jgi:hypothetical protein
LSLSVDERLAEQLSLQAYSGSSSGFEDCIEGGQAWWLPEMLQKLYKFWQKHVVAEGCILKETVCKGSLVPPDSRSGTYAGTL